MNKSLLLMLVLISNFCFSKVDIMFLSNSKSIRLYVVQDAKPITEKDKPVWFCNASVKDKGSSTFILLFSDNNIAPLTIDIKDLEYVDLSHTVNINFKNNEAYVEDIKTQKEIRKNTQVYNFFYNSSGTSKSFSIDLESPIKNISTNDVTCDLSVIERDFYYWKENHKKITNKDSLLIKYNSEKLARPHILFDIKLLIMSSSYGEIFNCEVRSGTSDIPGQSENNFTIANFKETPCSQEANILPGGFAKIMTNEFKWGCNGFNTYTGIPFLGPVFNYSQNSVTTKVNASYYCDSNISLADCPRCGYSHPLKDEYNNPGGRQTYQIKLYTN